MKHLAIHSLVTFAVSASATAVTLFDNGPLVTGATTASGVAAPAGFVWSEVAARAGEPGVSNNAAGFNIANDTFGQWRLADDFTIAAGQTWTLSSVRVFAYQTNSAAGTQPFASGATLRVWNGRPGDVDSSVIFGDTTTNRMTATGSTDIYRTFNSTTPPPGSFPGLTRLIRFLDLDLGGLNLGAGAYWIDWGATAASGFAPSITIPGQGNRPGDNARAWSAQFGMWVDTVDVGNPQTGADLQQDFPFIIEGSLIPGPGACALFGVAGLAGLVRRR